MPKKKKGNWAAFTAPICFKLLVIHETSLTVNEKRKNYIENPKIKSITCTKAVTDKSNLASAQRGLHRSHVTSPASYRHPGESVIHL